MGMFVLDVFDAPSGGSFYIAVNEPKNFMSVRHSASSLSPGAKVTIEFTPEHYTTSEAVGRIESVNDRGCAFEHEVDILPLKSFK